MSLLQQAQDQLASFQQGSLAEFSDLVLHTLFPNQFEYYLVGLALENSQGVETDRFIFPIKPTSLSNPDSIAASVLRTQGGVVSTYANGFSPNTIQITGHFGRDFKLMVLNRTDYKEFVTKKQQVEGWETTKKFVSDTVITGYGAFNKLRRLFNKSKELDPKNKPYKTVFYNLPYSQRLYVQLLNIDSNMSTDKNLIHQYTLTMKKIGVAATSLTSGTKVTGSGILASTEAFAQSIQTLVNQITV